MEMLIILTIGAWFKNIGIGILASFVVGLLAAKGWSQKIKKFSGKATVILKEVSEVLMEGSEFFGVLNNSIKDNGQLKENSIKEVIQAGKEVWAETEDVILIIKPKAKK